MTTAESDRVRRYRAKVRAEIEQLRAERGLFWRPRYAPPDARAAEERRRREAEAEIEAMWLT